MQWLNPSGAWALGSLLFITALYLLRRQSKKQVVPSLFLWKKATQDTSASKPFQKLKKNVLLFLQLLAALALVLCLLRPALPGGVRGETIMIFDLSASMQAKENGVSRLDMGVKRALEMADGMQDGDRVTILSAGGDVKQVLTRSGDRQSVRSALLSLQAENGLCDMQSALSLAKAMQRDMDGVNILVFSDTAEPSDGVLVFRTGASADNRALDALSISERSGAKQAFTRVKNYGAEATVTLECYADGMLCDVKTVTVPENGDATALFALPDFFTTLQVKIAEEDALLSDNTRYYSGEKAENYKAVLVGENVFIEKALALRDDVTVLKTTLADSVGLTNADLWIFDGLFPETMPETGAVLLINPDKEYFGIAPSDKKEAVSGSPRASGGQTAAELCQNLTLDEIALRSYRPLSGGSAILTLNGDALLSVSKDTRRAAVFGFDLHDSNLPLKADFPILCRNLLDYLLPQLRDSLDGASCGEKITVPADTRAENMAIITPSGQKIAVTSGSLFTETNETGLYSFVREYADGTTRQSAFALHIPTTESDTRSVGSAQTGNTENTAQSDTGHELTLYCILALLLLLLLEWGVRCRVA